MLVLSRREGESIVLAARGLTIRIMVTGLRHGGVKLGIEAPDEVNIVRTELLNKGNVRDGQEDEE